MTTSLSEVVCPVWLAVTAVGGSVSGCGCAPAGEGGAGVRAMLRAGGLARRPVLHPVHTQPPPPRASLPISARLSPEHLPWCQVPQTRQPTEPLPTFLPHLPQG